MGLASPSSITNTYFPASAVSVSQGDYFKFEQGGNSSYWQALDDGILGDRLIHQENGDKLYKGWSP